MSDKVAQPEGRQSFPAGLIAAWAGRFKRRAHGVVAGLVMAVALSHPGLASAATQPITRPPTNVPTTPPTEPPPTLPPVTGVPPTNVVTLGVVGSLDGHTIGLHFEEELDVASASAVTNYLINSGAVRVTNATARPDGHSVALQIDTPVRGVFSVAALLLDVHGAGLILPGVTNVVLGFSTGDVGSPDRAGSNFTWDNQTLEIIGGGSGSGGTADQLYLAEKTAGGDFDMRVRVTGLTGLDPGRRAGIFARATTNADSRGLSVLLYAPPPGDNRIQVALRTTAASPAIQLAEVTPSSIPNGWMRLQRVGDVFTSYRSSDGLNWIQIARTNQTFGPTMLVGIGVAANSNSLLATGTFSNLRLHSQIGLEAPVCSVAEGFVFSFSTEHGVTYQIQTKTNLNDPLWLPLTNFVGDGWRHFVTNSTPTGPARYYRAVIPSP